MFETTLDADMAAYIVICKTCPFRKKFRHVDEAQREYDRHCADEPTHELDTEVKEREDDDLFEEDGFSSF